MYMYTVVMCYKGIEWEKRRRKRMKWEIGKRVVSDMDRISMYGPCTSPWGTNYISYVSWAAYSLSHCINNNAPIILMFHTADDLLCAKISEILWEYQTRNLHTYVGCNTRCDSRKLCICALQIDWDCIWDS